MLIFGVGMLMLSTGMIYFLTVTWQMSETPLPDAVMTYSPASGSDINVDVLVYHESISEGQASSDSISGLQGRSPYSAPAEGPVLSFGFYPPSGVDIPWPVSETDISCALAVLYGQMRV